MKQTITKQFEFDYGHRVWSQVLDPRFSLDNDCVCRHLHGHRGVIIVELEGEVQFDGMVTDFKHLNWFKKWVDDNLDHKFIIDGEDPLFDTMLPDYTKYGLISGNWFRTVNKELIQNDVQKEYYESFSIVDFVPTSENLCRWFHKILTVEMKDLEGVIVSSVVFKETPKTSSRYEVKC